MYVYFIIILLLATNFGPKIPLSGQYLQPQYSQYKVSTQLTTDSTSKRWQTPVEM